MDEQAGESGLLKVEAGALVLPGEDRQSQRRWHEKLLAYRHKMRAHYEAPESPAQLQRCFVEALVFLYDNRLYDEAARRWRIEEFFDRGAREFGGYDQVVLWQSYPRLGVDEKNQFDYYRQLPDGVDGLCKWVEVCHRRQVRVLLAYNPWDTDTRGGDRHLEDMLEILSTTGAEGIYLDTLHQVPAGWVRACEKLAHPVAFETEGTPVLEDVAPLWSSWGQGWPVQPPGQLYNIRWLFPGHKVFLTHHRQKPNHWDEICAAFFTGTGILVWENVFGNDCSWVERDKALLRALVPILRAFWVNFANPDWQAFVPTDNGHLKVNRWPASAAMLYTLLWYQTKPYQGPLFPARQDRTYLDLITGKPLAVEGGRVIGKVDARSVGAVLEVEEVSQSLGELLQEVCPEELPTFTECDTRRRIPPAEPDRTVRLRRFNGHRPVRLPAGMVWVPPGRFRMIIKHDWQGADCYAHQLWDSGQKVFNMPGFAIDRYPVTNDDFARFLQATGYVPPQPENFLKHWVDGNVPPGLGRHPVVYVSLEDARAYVEWAGKRLPTEAEWQYAAQGGDGRPWPWGGRTGEPFDVTRVNPGGSTMPVGSFANDASPFGLHDLCGHVWQWVDDTYTDRVHRFTVLKGGSFFRLPGSASKWYIHSGPLELASHIKIPLLSASLDRFSTVGFRCVVD